MRRRGSVRRRFKAPLATEANPLEQLLDTRDLVLVTGKGGTGKSTLAAALALLAAKRRGRAVAVEVSASPRLGLLIPPGARVSCLNIDVEYAVGPALGRLTGLPALSSAFVRSRALKAFVNTSPAVREMIVLDELRHVVEVNARDRAPVLVDLPASGHALSFLDTPRSVHRMLRVGPLAQVARRAEELLHDPRRTEVVAVALPEELPVNETIELVRRCAEIGVGAHVVVMNQVPASPLHADDHPLLDAVQLAGGIAVGRFADAARSHSDAAAHAREQIERLRAAVSAKLLEVPRWPAPEPAECARLVAQALLP
jgi:anion-transporting  ArsA/GET3 family ATPase